MDIFGDEAFLTGARRERERWRSRTKVTTALGRFAPIQFGSSHFFTLPNEFIRFICSPVPVNLNPKKRVIPGEGAKEKQAKGEGLQQKGTTSQRRGKFEVASVQDAVL